MTDLHRALDAVATPLRRRESLAWLAIGAAVGACVLATAAWLARVVTGAMPWLVLGAWAMVAGASVVVVALAIGRVRRWSRAAVAATLEGRGAWRRGAIAALLEPPVAGTSEALHHAAHAARAREVAQNADGTLAPVRATLGRRARRASGIAVVALLALAGARPLSGASALLWRPWQAWAAVRTPVTLVVRDSIVDRGAPARLDVVAIGHRTAIVSLRAPGEAWQDTLVALDAEGRATLVTPPLAGEMHARAVVAGRRSEEVRIAVRLPAFLGDFRLEARYPDYLGIDDAILAIEDDTLVVPEGTQLHASGLASAPLAFARLVSAGRTVPLAVDGGAIDGTLMPAGTATWQLELAFAQGGAAPTDLPAFTVAVLADSAPQVEIPVPGADTVAPPSGLVPLVVTARDDHALRSLVLELEPSRGPASRRALPLDAEAATALVQADLSVAALGLLPGDSLRYTVVASDNAPRPRVGRSRTFVVRVPTADEQRAARREAAAEAAAQVSSVAQAAREATKATEDLARERPRGTGRGTAQADEPLARDAARRAEQAAGSQEALEREVDAARQAVADLERAAEQRGIADTALARQLGEVRALLDKAITPELREKLAELQRATQALDADRTRSALRDLAEEQAKMRDALERARELLKRAASETALADLAAEAKRLAEQQAAAEAALAKDAEAGAKTEEQLATQTDSLASSLRDAATEAPTDAAKQGLQQAAQQAQQAAQAMRNAARSARAGEQQQARQSARNAQQQLAPLGEQLEQNRAEMQEAMRAEVAAALDRALAETTRMLDRQQRVAEAYRRGALASTLRTEQGIIEEGVARIMTQVLAAQMKNALVSPRIGAALGSARQAMRGALEATSAASPNLGQAAEQGGDAVDALAVAAYGLLRSRDAVSNSESGSGMAEAMAQMQQMAGQQSQLAQEGGQMMQQGQAGMEQMMQLAMQQRAIAQQLERLQAQGTLPGAGQLGREAQELARQLEQGRLAPETVARQERLFRRMLDAGRSLQGEEEDERKEREAERADAVTVRRPEMIDPRALRNAGDVPLPSWEALQRLGADERRRVLDYFRRLASGGVP